MVAAVSRAANSSECAWLKEIADEELYCLLTGSFSKEKAVVIAHAISGFPGCVPCAERIASAMRMGERYFTQDQRKEYRLVALGKIEGCVI